MNNLKKDFLKKLQEKISDAQEGISNGVCQNMHDYGTQCGRVKGMLEIRRLFEDTWEEYFRVNNLDDDDKEFR